MTTGWRTKSQDSALQTYDMFLGPKDKIGEGDSRILCNVFADSPKSTIQHTRTDRFASVKNEVEFHKMFHASGEVPRLVCVQGSIKPDGSEPIYRHPSDQSPPLKPFSSSVLDIKRCVEELVGHAMNHVLIQYYRSGQDFISEHSDKTLDIRRGSSIVNISLGSQRIMRLRTKKDVQSQEERKQRRKQLIPLPHESIFILGQDTNRVWLHGINADKRPSTQRLAAENAYNGERISLTFREIATFINKPLGTIWGQGATDKTGEKRRLALNGDEQETARLIRMFGIENHNSSFDWDEVYGEGSDVLHFTKPSSTEQRSVSIV